MDNKTTVVAFKLLDETSKGMLLYNEATNFFQN